jgi:hypothetical protein
VPVNVRSKWASLPVLLLTLATGLSVGGIGSAAATRGPVPSKSTLRSFSLQTTRAQVDCQADGATVSTALADFEAKNPGRHPTVVALESRARGGPYLPIWPYNPTYYRYSIDAQGVLEIAILKAAGPPFVYAKAVAYKGPQDCAGVETLAGAQTVLRAVGACEADGTTASTAVAAYEAKNPGMHPTVAALESNARGGPYLQAWSHNPAYYRYSIDARGVLEIAIVKSSAPSVTYSALTPYRGPQDCSFG